MKKGQLKDKEEFKSFNSGSSGLVSESIMNTPLMQQKAKEQQNLFGDIIQKQDNKTGIPDNLKSGMESLSGMSLDHVKVHYNSSKPASVQAHAFAQGSDIHIASGQEKHLPHELGHVVQQAEGRVKPTTAVGGVAVNDSPKLESEATNMGNKALQMKQKSEFVSQNKKPINKPLQLASEYDGLLPSHGSWQDSYSDGQNPNVTEFTYHHIIPENKLKDVARAFIEIKNNIADYTNSQDIKDSYNDSLETLKDNAKGVWLNTRIQDVVYNFNREFGGDGVTVNEAQVRNILKSHNDHKGIFVEFQKIILPQKQQQVESTFGQRRQLLSSSASNLSKLIKEGLKLVDNIQNYQFPNLDVFNAFDDIMDVGFVTKKIRDSWNEAQTKADVVNAVKNGIASWKFKDYYKYKCTILGTAEYFGDDSLTRALAGNSFNDGSLNKLIRSYALPHDDDNDFYLKSAVQWNPGNIHRGPSSSKRRNPDDNQNFNEFLDDGGDRFEKAAVQILTTEHFQDINKLNNDVDAFLANNDRNEAKIQSATNLAKDMQKLQNRGLTEFNQNDWEPIHGGGGKMRLKAAKVQNQTDYDNVLNPPQPVNDTGGGYSTLTKVAAGVLLVIVGGGSIMAGISYFG